MDSLGHNIASSEDSDEMAHNDSSRLDFQCESICFYSPKHDQRSYLIDHIVTSIKELSGEREKRVNHLISL